MVTFSTIYLLTLHPNNRIFMKINAKTKYCQTCGIPLDIDYTNLEVNQNVEYCDYCLHHGVKPVSYTHLVVVRHTLVNGITNVCVK